jgi:hypothetical protein
MSRHSAGSYHNITINPWDPPETTAAGKKLNSLSTEELRLLVQGVSQKAAELSGKAAQDRAMADFCADHPEFVADGLNGEANGRALRTWLLSQGATGCFNRNQIEAAFEALAPLGALVLNGEVRIVDEEDTASLSLEELRSRANEQLQRHNLR